MLAGLSAHENLTAMEPAPGLACSLKCYQKQGLGCGAYQLHMGR